MDNFSEALLSSKTDKIPDRCGPALHESGKEAQVTLF